MANWNEKLLAVVKNEDIKSIENCFSKGAEVNCSNTDGTTPLILAADLGCTETVELLIRQKADVNAKNKQGWSALHRAAMNGHKDTVKLLISKQANVNILNQDVGIFSAEGTACLQSSTLQDNTERQTPLHLAAEGGFSAVVDQLITTGANINSTEHLYGETSLHKAAKNGNMNIVNLLIAHGASVNIQNYDKQKPKQLAEKQNHIEIAELLSSLDEVKSKEDPKNIDTEVSKSKVHPALLNRFLGEGSYESFDTRVMVVGQFGVGKTSLVMNLVGGNVPEEKLPTNGISILEGRCGVSIEGKEWILIEKEEHNELDVVYNKVLMSSDDKKSSSMTDTANVVEVTESKPEPDAIHEQEGQIKQSQCTTSILNKTIQRQCSNLQAKMNKERIQKS